MNDQSIVNLARDVEAYIVPAGDKVTLIKGEEARITQSLGGSYTVIVRGNLFRIDGKNADALGIQMEAKPISTTPGPTLTGEELEKQMWSVLRNCYDPEIPVNIVDLGLVYDRSVKKIEGGDTFCADVKMTLTAPGCGMGPMIAQDAQTQLLGIEGIDEANVELVWDPPWNQGMMTEAAKLQLGLL